MIKFTIILCAAFLLTACATAEKPSEPVATSQHPPAPSTVGKSQEDIEERIDLLGLGRSLGLETGELGYHERTFDTCGVGYGFSSSHRCRRQTMAVINVRIQCRDSEGTISTALGAADLVAIANQGIQWTLQKRDGVAMTDGEGYATIRSLFDRAPKNDWLRLALGVQHLNMRASTITRVVTPRPWCVPGGR